MMRWPLALMLAAVIVAPADAGQYCPSKAHVRTDGSVLFDGVRYADHGKLKTVFAAYKRRNPSCMMLLTADKDARFQAIGSVVLALQETGLLGRVGFLTEPRNP